MASDEQILPDVYLFNSLGLKREKLIADNDRTIRWYNCGPTVYDSSHMGHARSYISLDIIRRILVNIFKYKVIYCMNITDIDDKIIKRARQQYLWEEYCREAYKKSVEVIFNDMSNAVEFYKTKMAAETDPEKVEMMRRLFENFIVQVTSDCTLKDILNQNRDILVEYLDSIEGCKVTDNSIFTKLPKKFEDEFFRDMKSLNILDPDILTRVSEYVPKIVIFIQKIIDNAYAYESNGSVYFDTVKFGSSSKHKYGKLMPEAIGDAKALSEGEGVLSGDSQIEKRHPNDFALWKKSKAGEPSWESPWGLGRPGWHIECSVMSTDALKGTIHLHSGGIDLKFPHHENEIAQSEAYFDSGADWIKYWLHTGHLTISGCKMSKSLKNFITIKESLTRHTARQIRLAFLLHSWNDTLDYSNDTMKEAFSFEEKLDEFYLSIKACLRENTYNCDKLKEIELKEKLVSTRDSVLQCLADNFNTKLAMKSLVNLIGAVNKHLEDFWSADEAILLEIFNYIVNLLRDLGAWEEETPDDKKREEDLYAKLKDLRDTRLKLRKEWKVTKSDSLLQQSDEIRKDAEKQGVKFEDKEIDGQMCTKIKLLTLKMQDRRKERVKLDNAIKLDKERKQREVQEARDAQRKIPPSQMFLDETDKYSLFDENVSKGNCNGNCY